MLVAARAGEASAAVAADTRKARRRIIRALYQNFLRISRSHLLAAGLAARRRWRRVVVIVIIAEQPAQQTAAMVMFGLLLLLVRRQVGRVSQPFVIAAIPGRTRCHQFLVLRRRLHGLVQRLVGLALFGRQHGVPPDIGGQGAAGDAAGGRGIV